MLTIIFSIIAMIFLFGITIFVHEFGHFIVARKCGLIVETFSIGMGPAIWKKEIGGIVYKVSAFPIGGYVSLPQLDPEGMEKMQGENENDRKELPEVSPWKKIAVALAGPLFNIIFAIPLALLVTLSEPPPEHTVIGKGIAAEQVKEGDKILSVNGKPVSSWYDVMSEDLLSESKGSVELLIQSGFETNKVELPSKSTFEKMAPAMIPLIARAPSGDPANKAGIQSGDLITAVNGKPIKWWHELSSTLQDYGEQQITITFQRGSKSITKNITPRFTEPKTDKEEKRVIIGVTPGDPGMLPWTMEGNAFQQIQNDASKIFRLLKALTSKSEAGSAAKSLGGPVSIFTLIWFSLKLGFLYALGLIRFININLAVLNLLPIPVLDGGHICFALWEGITKRKVPPRIVATLVNTFAILLIGTMLVLSWRDVDRNWGISRFFHKAKTEQVKKPSAPEPDKHSTSETNALNQIEAPAQPE